MVSTLQRCRDVSLNGIPRAADNATVTAVHRVCRRLLLLFTLTALAGCALLQPLPDKSTMDARLAALPTEGLPLQEPVTIRWNDYKVPFIEAQNDDDAAFTLGLVHAHLRLGQMAVVRRILQGRISESAGPLTTDLDAALRAFDFYRPADAIYAAMPTQSRRWVDRYVAGVNHYAANLPADGMPHPN